MVYISLGSNLGNRFSNIRKALQLLKERCLSEIHTTIILETVAILPPDAPASWDIPYLNTVVAGKTHLSSEELLNGLKQIEKECGREENREKWSPRVIDLDILIWEGVSFSSPNLSIPHPELMNRPFLIHLLTLLNPWGRYSGTPHSPYEGLLFSEIAFQMGGTQDCFINSYVIEPEFVGIVNITPDSFSDGNLYFQPSSALKQIQALNSQGASVIELGAQSSRPNAQVLPPSVEWERLQPVLDSLKSLNNEDRQLLEGSVVGLDTYYGEIVEQALSYGLVSYYNELKDLRTETLYKIADSGSKIVSMHSLSLPVNPLEVIPFSPSPIEILLEWGERKVKHLTSCGFTREQIILDPGIGFGKTHFQNISLLKTIERLKELGCKVLVGHSRKGFISRLSPYSASERDIETLGVSANLAKSGVDYLRVHNVSAHQRFFVAQHATQLCKGSY